MCQAGSNWVVAQGKAAVSARRTQLRPTIIVHHPDFWYLWTRGFTEVCYWITTDGSQSGGAAGASAVAAGPSTPAGRLSAGEELQLAFIKAALERLYSVDQRVRSSLSLSLCLAVSGEMILFCFVSVPCLLS